MSCRHEFASGTDAREARNPAKPAERVGRCGIPFAAEPEAMVERASDAQADCARAPRLERAERLNAFLDAVVARVNGIAEAAALEQGEVLADARAETLKGCAEGRFTAGKAARIKGAGIASGRPGVSDQILRWPRGVIFCVSPRNFPAMTPLRKICPAAGFSNAVVLNPSQFMPTASCMLAGIAKDHFPENLIRTAMISGRPSGELAAKADIHGVSFSGSAPTRRLVYAAAQNLVPARLEPGGKNAAVLSDTDDLNRAVDLIFGAAFQTSGQRCTTIGRALVQRDLAARTKGLPAKKADVIRLGDGMDPDAQMGPLRNLGNRPDVCDVTAKAIAERRFRWRAAGRRRAHARTEAVHARRSSSGTRSANASEGRKKSSAPFFRLSSMTASTRRSRC